MRLAPLAFAFSLFALPLMADETALASGPPPFRLLTLNGQSVTADVTLELAEPGRLAGRAPCNRYFGEVAGTMPDFRPGAIAATRMACDDLALEGAYFAALSAVTTADLLLDRLILTGPGGVELIFARAMN